jgi:hypothetical protein
LVDHVGDLLTLLVYAATIFVHEFIEGKVPTSYSDDNCFLLKFHENSALVMAIYAIGLTLKQHLATHAQRFFVDEVCQLSIDSVFPVRLINEWLLNKLVLSIMDDLM